MADQVVILDQGKIAQIGSPEEVYQRPVTPYVASFMGAENIIDCEVEAGVLRVPRVPQAAVRLGDAQAPTGRVQVHFRSEMASLDPAGGASGDCLCIPGTIAQASYLGGTYRCEIHTDCGHFFIDHPLAARAGDPATINIPVAALHVFPRDAARPS